MEMYGFPHFSLYQLRCTGEGRASQFLGKRGKKTVSFQEEDSCLSQIDPHAAAFASGNSAISPDWVVAAPDTTHQGLTGGDKSDQSKLEGVSAVGDSAHTHMQGLNIMKHQQYLGFQQQPSLALHKPLFAAACMAASSNSCPLEEPDRDVRGFWTKLSIVYFSSLSELILCLCVCLAHSLCGKDSHQTAKHFTLVFLEDREKDWDERGFDFYCIVCECVYICIL